MLTHRSNYLNAANFMHHMRVDHDDVYLHTLPMFHANGWGGVWAITAAIKDGWFYTEDLAVTHPPDGFIEIRDRAKDLIISGGENISSTEVEGVLYKQPDILEVAVIAIPDEKWGEVPLAIIVLQPAANLSEEEVIRYCRDHMAHFKAPKAVKFVEELPKTATGKLQKYRLREMFWRAPEKLIKFIR